jgi:hypothetical protein
VTDEAFFEYWPTATDEIGMADLMNVLPSCVASTTLDELDWNNASLLTGDVADACSVVRRWQRLLWRYDDFDDVGTSRSAMALTG